MGLLFFMLQKENRLTKDRDFTAVFKEGQFGGAKFLTIKVWKIEPEKYPRRKYQTTDLKIGFLVSKKVDKRAVMRNRTKRKMREVVRLLLLDNKIKPGFLIAVVAKPEVMVAEYADIERDIIFLLKRFGVLL